MKWAELQKTYDENWMVITIHYEHEKGISGYKLYPFCHDFIQHPDGELTIPGTAWYNNVAELKQAIFAGFDGHIENTLGPKIFFEKYETMKIIGAFSELEWKKMRTWKQLAKALNLEYLQSSVIL